MEKPKSCPFCGSSDVHYKIDDTGVECHQCEAAAPADVWNSRNSTKSADPMIEDWCVEPTHWIAMAPSHKEDVYIGRRENFSELFMRNEQKKCTPDVTIKPAWVGIENPYFYNATIFTINGYQYAVAAKNMAQLESLFGSVQPGNTLDESKVSTVWMTRRIGKKG